MKKLLLCVVAIASAHASSIVNMVYQGSSTTPDGFYHFVVDGTPKDLICDDVTHYIGSGYYLAEALSLTDNLTNSLSARDGDSDPLAKYTLIAMLDMRAYADTSLADDVRSTVRHIINPLATPAFSHALLDWATAQNPADYDLTGFRIFAPLTHGPSGNPPLPNSGNLNQEQTGFVTPEPASMVLMGAGLLACGLFRRFTRKRPMQ